MGHASHGPGCVCVQIELPEYSTEDIMRKRIIAAITYGNGGFLIA